LINLGFTTDGRLADVLIIPSSWGSQWGVTYTPSAAAMTPPDVMGYRQIQVSRRGRNGEVDFGGSMVPPEAAPIDNGRRLQHRGRKDRKLKF
jgi:hypothetical protein